jgi:lipid-A-disaccharide synthase
MPNLIAGREIAPELLQENLTGARLAALITELLSDEERLGTARRELSVVRAKLGEARASERAAQAILARLTEIGQKAETMR